MDEPSDRGDAPSATPASLKGREEVLLRAKIVCAVYDFYCRAKGGIDLSNTTRAEAYQDIQTLTQAKACNELFTARACIAERLGQYVLFAPCDSRFREAYDSEKPIYQHRPELDVALQREWERFCDMLGMSVSKKETFYTPEGFQRENDFSVIYTNSTHTDKKSEGWQVFLEYALAAVGTGTKYLTHVGDFERLKPGDLIGNGIDSTTARGLGIVLSNCHISPNRDDPKGKVYYSGEDFYPFHVDVAWLHGKVNGATYALGREAKMHGLRRPGTLNRQAIPTATYQFLLNHTMNSSSQHIDELKEQLIACHNLVLTGPPGTGKTHLAKEIAMRMGADEKKRSFVQFHPAYDYTDFVEGLRPTPPNADGNIGFKHQDGVFKKFCKKALKDREHKYVFIIDEINRGELSRIFGELFFSLDPDYRVKEKQKPEIPITTQYQNLIPESDDFHENKGGFYVPDNVYIIGTMNDIDRSVESLDFAIRRRFTWHEVKASDTCEEIIQAKVPKALRERAMLKLESLNSIILADKELGSSYEIGGAYFAKLKQLDERAAGDPFTDLWNYHLKGLLAEYLRGRSDAGEVLATMEEAYNVKSREELNRLLEKHLKG